MSIKQIKMGISLADQYFLKAYDTYYYDISESVEALNYALSYDEEHAPSLCLMGRLYMEKLKSYTEAKRYFEFAIFIDPNYVDTYKYYSQLLIWTGEFSKAKILLRKAKQVKGISREMLLHRIANIYEFEGHVDLALKELNKAKLYSSNKNMYQFFSTEIDRMKKKCKKNKKTKNKLRKSIA